MKTLKNILIAVALTLTLSLPAQAAEFKQDDNSINITESQVHKDLHLASGNVTVDSKVSGDLLIAGGTILVNGEVEGSLFVTGGTVTVRSNVKNHIRIAGGQITLSGATAGDVFIGAGTLIIDKQAVIEGGLYAAGGDITINGVVKGESKIATGNLILNGEIGVIKAYADKITINDTGKINGDLNYYSKQKANISDTAVISGQIQYHETVSTNSSFFRAGSAYLLLLRLLGSFLLGWALIKYFKRFTDEVVTFAKNKSLISMGFGFVNLFLSIILIVLLMVSVIGTGFGFILLNFWFMTLLIGSIVAKVTLGSWIERLISKDKNGELSVRTAAIGVVGYYLILFIPVIGPMATFFLFLIGTGSIFNKFIHSFERNVENN